MLERVVEDNVRRQGPCGQLVDRGKSGPDVKRDPARTRHNRDRAATPRELDESPSTAYKMPVREGEPPAA